MSLKFKMIVSCIVRCRRRTCVATGRNIAIAVAILESVRIVTVRDK
ncbi:hypothetical protein BURCENK562V_C2718 [Burkholderia cenocepacia K56-2Valvano]|nr:hypothetical protein BURCENK562V_C2718 [Burkholderia cenocepacia K56-2Valvano]